MEAKCFKFFDLEKTQSEAKDYCKENGGNLASVTNSDINDLISKFGHYVHIGAEKVAGSWVWADGSVWSYSNWEDGQGQSTIELCVKLYPNGKWHDWYCDDGNKQYFVCSQDSHKIIR